MASEPILRAFELPVVQRSHFWDSKIWLDYLALTKPEVNFLIVITTFAGFYLGCPSGDFPFLRSMNAVLGTLLVASGTGALNQYIERRFDAQNAPDSPAAPGGGTAQSISGFVVRYCVIGFRNCLSCCGSQSACEPPGARHVVVLFVFLHSAQEEVAVVHSGRSIFRRDASADWMGCSI